jgi:hypothetical protein
VDIVAIGDSHTYGNTAKMVESWPFVLGRLTGRSVYNLALGGYGPNQYYHLLKSRALALRPKLVICGLYMGDDFENAYLITYGLPYWAHLRALPPHTVDYDIWHAEQRPAWHKRPRVWLSRHSVVYKLLVHGPLAGRLKGDIQISQAHAIYGGSVVSLVVPERNIREAFIPRGILKRLNQDDPRIVEGMRITFELLREMNEMSRQHDAKFLVAIIPTKEMVFAEYLEHNAQLPLHDVLDGLLANERKARERTFQFLTRAGIGYVDTLPILRRSMSSGLYAHTAADMHPGRNGYRMIAEAVATALNDSAAAR